MESTFSSAAEAFRAARASRGPRQAATEKAPPAEAPRPLDIERGPNWLFVRVRMCCPVDSEGLSLAQRVTSAMDQHFIYRVVLELEEAVLPCERLIAELRMLDQWIQDHQGVLRLCGLPHQYTRRFHRAHLADHLPLYHDREEAVWGGPHQVHPR